MKKRLVLVGGGHAHLEVLRSLRTHPLAGVDVTLVSPEPRAAYTGMVPGLLSGEYQPDELSFNLRALAAAAGARFVEAEVERVDGGRRLIATAGRDVPFDLCSINAGSSPAGARIPGVHAHALALRPLSNALQLRDRFDQCIAAMGATPASAYERQPPRAEASLSVVVVGGGAAGVEVAIALALRGAGQARVTLLHEGIALLDASPARARRLAARACVRAGIDVRLGARVAQVDEGVVTLADGGTVASALTVWLAGAAPPGFLARSRLPLTSAGFLEIDDTLRATDGSPVWGAGDCAVMPLHPWVPRAGVYAVRQGRVLAHNLRTALTGMHHPERYEPQRGFLSLMVSGERRALLAWRAIAVDARWPRWLKRRIDLAFMRRHTVSAAT